MVYVHKRLQLYYFSGARHVLLALGDARELHILAAGSVVARAAAAGDQLCWPPRAPRRHIGSVVDMLPRVEGAQLRGPQAEGKRCSSLAGQCPCWSGFQPLY